METVSALTAKLLARSLASRGITPPGVARPSPIQRMEVLVTVAGSVLEAVQDEQLLAAKVADLASSTLGGAAGIWLAKADTGGTIWATPGCGGIDEELAGTIAPHITDDLKASAADGVDRPVLINGTDSSGPDWMRAVRLASYALFPIVAGGRLLGGLVVTWTAQRPTLTTEDLSYVRTLARITGVTMFNARILADSALGMEELRQHSELIDHMSDAVISCDADGRVVSWNAGAERIYGYSNAEALGCDLFALLGTEFLNSDGLPVPLNEVLEAAAAGGWQGESRERSSDGTTVNTLVSLTGRVDREGRQALIVVNRDVTAQRREEYEALHDSLTGLPNRRMLTLRLYDAYARACRYQASIAVLFIDLDKFKPINDTHGHSVGDEVLKAVAKRLSAAVRQTDTVARIGGDEFVVVLQDSGTRASVTDVTRRILDAIAEPILVHGDPDEDATTGVASAVGSAAGAASGTSATSGTGGVQTATDGRTVHVSASIGVAHATEPTFEGAAEHLLEAADKAMYEAKRERKGIVFTDEPPAAGG